ncbi:MAG: c-type cytochrome [Bdellovibrionales bacterium]|nr:c-type cytochrome [Bdellovibrionales bacterium]
MGLALSLFTGLAHASPTHSLSFAQPMSGLSPEQHEIFRAGEALFQQGFRRAPSFNDAEGLGPYFNSNSCALCHALGGGGLAPRREGNALFSVLIRLSVPGTDEVGGPLPDPRYGHQLNPASIRGLHGEGLAYRKLEIIRGEYADGTRFELARPLYRIERLASGPLAPDLLISPRIAPRIIGMGLLEAIPEQDILARQKISGRANWVWDAKHHRQALGRFGWKANQPSVEQQDAGAFNGDMGLTTSLFPREDCGPLQSECLEHQSSLTARPEISDLQLAELITYTKHLNVPAPTTLNSHEARRGAQLFSTLACTQCHATTFVTGEVPGDATLSRRRIHPYSDLLLHDMGPELADGRPDFLATGTEWRTPPLWGLGSVEAVSGRTSLLHDGRARSIEEAILWHGGEATASREAFRQLSARERSQLLQFLKSL